MATSLYNNSAVQAAKNTSDAAIQDVLSRHTEKRAVVVSAPPGAGKSHLVSSAVGQAREMNLRVAVATPTNEQAFQLVRILATQYPVQMITFVPAVGVVLPTSIQSLPNVKVVEAKNANGASVIVGTLDKLGDAIGRKSLLPVDILLIDESYQADSARYYSVAPLAPSHLLVGDSGQLNPFSTINDPDRWKGLPEDPLQTAVGVLRRNHPKTPVYQLPISRRLDSRGVSVAKLFYPSLSFEAAVLPGTRELRLLKTVTKDQRTKNLDKTLDLAAIKGWAHLELPEAPVLISDQETVSLIVSLVERLFDRGPQTRCEISTPAPLERKRVAVCVSHNEQKDLLRIALSGAGYSDVVVNTANKLQGLEFDLVIAWHPLAGLADPDGFHLDPGRMCVMLSRHRHACIVVGRAGDRALLETVPPKTPSYLGWDPDPVLDGWEAHQAVFDALEGVRVSA
jgi:hypothetical protein